MAAVSDWIHSGKFDEKNITVNLLKSGPRRVSDIALQQLALRDVLLGPWLDSQNSPPIHEEQVSGDFDSRMTYRQYMPVDTAAAPNTWLFSWPKFGHLLVNFLGVIMYDPMAMRSFAARPRKSSRGSLDASP